MGRLQIKIFENDLTDEIQQLKCCRKNSLFRSAELYMGNVLRRGRAETGESGGADPAETFPQFHDGQQYFLTIATPYHERKSSTSVKKL